MTRGSERRLIDLLPAVYRQSPQLDSFLAVFERLLFRPSGGTGAGAGTESGRSMPGPSLEQQIDSIPSRIDPFATGDEFLEWLAQWAGISLYHEAPDRRRVIAEMIPLYKKRGTKEYLKRVLELYVDGTVSVDEDDRPGMALGSPERARVGIGTRLGEDAFGFTVSIDFPTIPPGRQERARMVSLARKVIDLAKPAYSHYRLEHNLTEARGLVISVRSAVGVNTVLERAAKRARGASRSYERYGQ